MTNTNTFCFISISNLKTGRFETIRFVNLTFVNLTFCKPDVLKPDVLKPDVLKPDVLKPDVLWVYRFNTGSTVYYYIATLFMLDFYEELGCIFTSLAAWSRNCFTWSCIIQPTRTFKICLISIIVHNISDF